MQKKASTIPQTNKKWYVFCTILNAWVLDDKKTPFRPYAFLALDPISNFILNVEILQEEPTSEKILELIYQIITEPKKDSAPKHRPTTIKFEDQFLANKIADELAEIGIETSYAPDRKMSSSLIRELTSQINKNIPQMVGLSSKSSISLVLKRAFYKSAAEFYRAKPWIYLTNNDILSIQIPPHNPYYISVMGNAGMEYGMIVFKKLEHLEAFYQLHTNPDQRIPKSGWHALDFEKIYQVPFDDLDDIELNDFEIAAENAYPIPVIYFQNGTHARPGREMLIWYMIALRAIAIFTQEYLKTTKPSVLPIPTTHQIKVQTGEILTNVEIQFPIDELPDQNTVPPLEHGNILESAGFGNSGTEAPDQITAQEIIYDAWEESDQEERIAMAWNALEIDPLCADAYIILANDFARNDKERLEFFQKSVEAGEKRLGKEFFEENTGHFWIMIETRPYMRALNGLGTTLWALKESEKAEKTYRRMLELNPGDNQGIRYLLIQLLMDMEKYSQTEKLIKEYQDASAYGLFNQALLKYQKSGPGKASNKLLKEANDYNPFVKEYLTDKKSIPNESPPYYGIGDENEAIFYTKSHLNHWHKVPGAVDWLKETLNN